MTWRGWQKSPGVATWLVVALSVVIFLLVRSGLRASREWQRSSVSLAERRASEAASMMVSALDRDMRAVQTLVLSSPVWDEFTYGAPHDVPALVASAFARYPYPDAFIAWRVTNPESRMAFFVRAERPPAWSHLEQEPQRFPVRTVTDARLASLLFAAIRPEIDRRLLAVVSELNVQGTDYQLIVRLRYRDPTRQQLIGICGFLVDLTWVREHYFPDFARQMARIAGDDALAFGIADERGQAVVTTRPFVDTGLISNRPFPVMFFDPATIAVNPPGSFKKRQWIVLASGAADPAIAAAIRGSDRTFVLAAVAALVFALGLVLTARAARASAKVADMRAEFVASVTHELKTPIASIRVLGHALRSGRVKPTAVRDYGGLVVQESKRLSRLIDNLLAHSRVTDSADIYEFEPLSIRALVDAAITGFSSQMAQANFDVTVNIPDTIPSVRADRGAMELLLDNLIDNSVRYSTATRELTVSAVVHHRMVRLAVADRGIGIPADELTRVTRKFVRGRGAPSGGSGLGLAIVKRIVDDHGGALAITSEVDQGTTVTVDLPIAGEIVRSEEPASLVSPTLVSGAMRG